MNRTSLQIVTDNAFIWLIGWMSLGIVEIVLRFTITPSPLTLVIIFALLVYSILGLVLGSIYGIITLLIHRLWSGLNKSDKVTCYSMAVCIGLILFICALLFVLKVSGSILSPIIVIKGIVVFAMSVAVLFVLSFFFRWMDQKGRLFTFYLSLLPSLWVITSLCLHRNKDLFPPVLQITTLFRTLLLIIGSILCFFLFYFLFSLVRRFLSKWKATPFLKLSLIILPFIFLVLFLFLLLREGDGKGNIREIKNAPTGKLNILLITLDTTRVDHISCYGYGRPTTPNLDNLSQEGILYKNAYATASWTLPSHASIFTGKYPAKHGAHYDPDFIKVAKYLDEHQIDQRFEFGDLVQASIFPLVEENITLAEILSERGYRTAGIIGGYMCSSIFGLAQGFDYYNEKFFNIEKDIKILLICRAVEPFFSLNDFFTRYGYSAGDRIASDLNRSALRWLEKNYEEPFFLFINYFDPHAPHLPLSPHDEYFGKTDKSIIVNRNPKWDRSYIRAEWDLAMSVRHGRHQLTPEEKEILISRYDSEIRYVDYHLGLLFEKLKSLKIFDNTLIIVTADHGEAFGEHNFMYHKSSLYEEIIHIPLVIKYPYSSRRGLVEKQVSLVDLMPTVLAYLNCPIPSDVDGKVLEDACHPVIAEDYASWWQSVKGLRSLRAIYEGKYKYIWASDSFHELYDLEKDPREEENLIEKFPRRA
jgi:arylsulfatase A-like enzyme/MFS family permease